MDIDQAKQALREKGWCVVPSLLSPGELSRARAALDAAVDTMRRANMATHTSAVDPNDANIRVYSLPGWDPLFIEMLRHPVARALADSLIGPSSIVSNFTANIAMPGSGSMKTHADQALVTPPPWNEAWALNIIWCLDDVNEENGATRYVPDSHHFRSHDNVPGDIEERSVAFSAPAGSLIAMEGRVWHKSGANVSTDRRRAMLFAFYTTDFVRQQVNWEAALPAAVKDGLDEDARAMLGMGALANIRIGSAFVRTNPTAPRPDFRSGLESASLAVPAV